MLMSYQSSFIEFNKAIKLDDENKELRTSRDAIIGRINSFLKEFLDGTGIPLPEFFDQGSYAMKTGIKPVENECNYDIDEGLKFKLSVSEYSNPVEIKKWIAKALEKHTDLGVEIKEPCVTVRYSEDKKEKYHVDIAVYSNYESDITLKLARGTENSKNKYWESSEPSRLIGLINDKYSDEDREQFRRVIRYLKRWKDLKFITSGNSAPRGIALTIIAYNYFIPIKSGDEYDDLAALIHLVSSMISRFKYTSFNGENTWRIEVKLPVAPYNDLFSKMTNQQMNVFKENLENLKDLLASAQSATTNEDGLLSLNEAFGEDFPTDETKKNIDNADKPSIGYYPQPQAIIGYSEAEEMLKIKGFKIVKSNQIPIVSNQTIYGPGVTLYFETQYPVNSTTTIKWRVFNTGQHVRYLVGSNLRTANDAFRGNLFDGKRRNQNGIIVGCPNSLNNIEVTEFTGKHWIECMIFYNGKCIAKSKPFYVNIINPEFNKYD